MNQFIRQVTEQGQGQLLYNAFFVAGFVAVFLCAWFTCKNYKIPRGKALLFVVLVYTISVIWMFFSAGSKMGSKAGAETT